MGLIQVPPRTLDMEYRFPADRCIPESINGAVEGPKELGERPHIGWKAEKLTPVRPTHLPTLELY